MEKGNLGLVRSHHQQQTCRLEQPGLNQGAAKKLQVLEPPHNQTAVPTMVYVPHSEVKLTKAADGDAVEGEAEQDPKMMKMSDPSLRPSLGLQMILRHHLRPLRMNCTLAVWQGWAPLHQEKPEMAIRLTQT